MNEGKLALAVVVFILIEVGSMMMAEAIDHVAGVTTLGVSYIFGATCFAIAAAIATFAAQK